MPIKSDREYRDMEMEIRAKAEDLPDDEQDEQEEEQEEGRMIVEGYATTFNEPYTLYQDEELRYDEQVDADAFANTDMSDVIMQYDHNGRVFARLSNGTLSVTPDERGLLIEADLGGTELGRQLYEEIRGGYTNRMSFGFTVDDDDVQEDEDEEGRLLVTRTIKSVRKLYDVSAVSIPANDATSISVRNLTDGVIEKMKAERLEREAIELRRRKMMMRLKLEGQK